MSEDFWLILFISMESILVWEFFRTLYKVIVEQAMQKKKHLGEQSEGDDEK